MNGFRIIGHKGNEVLCNQCEKINEIDLVGVEISMCEFDGFHYNLEEETLTFEYPVWGNFNCKYCDCYNGYVFIEDIVLEVETISE